jgi:hypothetical protein
MRNIAIKKKKTTTEKLKRERLQKFLASITINLLPNKKKK